MNQAGEEISEVSQTSEKIELETCRPRILRADSSEVQFSPDLLESHGFEEDDETPASMMPGKVAMTIGILALIWIIFLTFLVSRMPAQ